MLPVLRSETVRPDHVCTAEITFKKHLPVTASRITVFLIKMERRWENLNYVTTAAIHIVDPGLRMKGPIKLVKVDLHSYI